MLAVVEMNLEEYPAFRLGRRSKRPELVYVRTRTDGDGRTLRQTWTVRGAEGLGLPGPFEQDLYVALLVLFTEQGLPDDGRIRFTRNRLAQVMGISNSGRGYELIEQGLSRLAGATVYTEHAFYRPAPAGKDGERVGASERLSLSFHILEEVRVYERRQAVLEEAEDGSARAGERPRVELARPMELSVARLGQPLVQSYERRYTKGLDATFYFSLTRPLGKRLYRYLDKVRNGRGSFEIGLRALADVLGLEYRYPSDIKDGLVEAHAELQSTGYLAGATYAALAGGPNAGEKVVYALDPAFDRRPRRRAGAAVMRSPHPNPLPEGEGIKPLPKGEAARRVGQGTEPLPLGEAARSAGEGSSEQATLLQTELEAFGITPSRAAALVAAHPEAHIRSRLEYVQSLMRRPSGSTGAVRTPVRNPAGLLARAIEQHYVIPEPARPASRAVHPVVPPRAPAADQAPVVAAVSAMDLALVVAVAPAMDPAPVVAAVSAMDPAPVARGLVPRIAAPAATSHPGATAPETPSGAPLHPASDHPLWSRLSAALKERLSPATYAAWIAPASPADAPPEGSAPEAGVAEDGVSAPGATLTLRLPSTFALDRWRRPPISDALKEACAAAGIEVTLETAPVPAEA